MTSQTLREARKYEEASEKLIGKEERPDFHLTPRTGWMNDPNGFSYYKGRYHLFYQYYPYESKWGPMHWGHAVSSDLLHWEYLPCALAPDEAYDRDGCFSGSAAVLPDGRQLLMYTGVLKEHQERDIYREVQTQCMAVGDGIDYEKYEQNPVLDQRDIPEGSSRFDFRDPKMWMKADGTYACVVGNRPADGSGQILLYESADGFQWKFKSILVSNHDRFGKMWECPDFFELDGKWVLLTSPQDMLPEGFEYHNGNGTLCLIGDYDEENGSFKEMQDQSVDYGIDFYAPQTFVDQQNRRILIGWMGMPDIPYDNPTCERGWQHALTIPRVLSYQDGMLYQTPIAELKAQRGEKHSGSVARFNDYHILERVYECTITIEQEASFSIQVRNEVYMKYDVDTKRFSLHMGADGSGRTVRSAILPSLERITIYSDTSSLEVFINDGAYVFTTRVYEKQAHTPLSINGKDLQGSVVWYKMNPYQWKS